MRAAHADAFDIEDRVGLVERARRELVGLGDGHHLVDADQLLELLLGLERLLPDGPDNGPKLAL